MKRLNGIVFNPQPKARSSLGTSTSPTRLASAFGCGHGLNETLRPPPLLCLRSTRFRSQGGHQAKEEAQRFG